MFQFVTAETISIHGVPACIMTVFGVDKIWQGCSYKT